MTRLKPVRKQKGATTAPRKRRTGHQCGLVLDDGTMVTDPSEALLELHDRANGITAPPKDVAREVAAPAPRPRTITDLAAQVSDGKRGREMWRKRMRSMAGKLDAWPPEVRDLFFEWYQATPNETNPPAP